MSKEQDLQQTVKQQDVLIRQLKQAIQKLEQKLLVLDRKIARVADTSRRTTDRVEFLVKKITKG